MDLKWNKYDDYEFYNNLSITKSFLNEEEYSSAFSQYIYESILASISHLIQFKLFRTVDEIT